MAKVEVRTPSDPWLMASEIALADVAEVKASFLSKGKRFLLEQTTFSSAHMTELAGAVAAAELVSGNLKRAREAQRKALLSPNDNVIAQAVDQEPAFGIRLDGPQIERALAESSEALVLLAWANVAPDTVETHAQAWHAEEPFSSRPIQMLTTLYVYKGELDQAVRWIRAGLLADPHDSGLLINLAYAQARMGKLAEAEATIRKLRSFGTTASEPYAKATEGLIAYRQGRFEAGDNLYDAAVALFEQTHRPGSAAYCRLNQALSAVDYQRLRADEIVKRANAVLLAHPTLDSLMLIKIRSELEIDDVQIEHKEKRRLSQWVFDPTTNTLAERPGVTAVGAKPLVILERKS